MGYMLPYLREENEREKLSSVIYSFMCFGAVKAENIMTGLLGEIVRVLITPPTQADWQLSLYTGMLSIIRCGWVKQDSHCFP